MSQIHLIGIGGSGMSAIARLLIEKGHSVSGSDLELSPLAIEVQNSGAQISIGHHADNVQGADIVIRSSAIPVKNVEVQKALKLGIPVYKRADYLGEIVAEKIGIAVAGTHGKTTTTAMISWMLAALDQDPSYLIGGVSKNLGVNAHAGRGDYFVIEADEYDFMFLGLSPDIAIVTNVEHDHPDCFPTGEDFFKAFVEFMKRIPENGTLIACLDDMGAAALLDQAKALDYKTLSYGIEKSSAGITPNFYADDLSLDAKGNYRFEVNLNQEHLTRIEMSIPGKHNVLNALAVIATAHQLSLSISGAARALSEYQGTGRRFESWGEFSGITVVDDYAHHPTEIRTTLAAARDRFPGRQIWAVWQPHTYSRTRTLFDDYLTAFDAADHVLVTEIYASREPVDTEFSANKIVERMQHPDVRFMTSKSQTTEFLLTNLKQGDVLMVLSAGDANQISNDIVEKLSSNGSEKLTQDG
jgi:UDP-N-acetylmuramate--alanine ligase